MLRVPNKLLKDLEKSKGLSFIVQITAHMKGEMRNPLSILVDPKELKPEILKVLISFGCKEIKEI